MLRRGVAGTLYRVAAVDGPPLLYQPSAGAAQRCRVAAAACARGVCCAAPGPNGAALHQPPGQCETPLVYGEAVHGAAACLLWTTAGSTRWAAAAAARHSAGEASPIRNAGTCLKPNASTPHPHYAAGLYCLFCAGEAGGHIRVRRLRPAAVCQQHQVRVRSGADGQPLFRRHLLLPACSAQLYASSNVATVLASCHWWLETKQAPHTMPHNAPDKGRKPTSAPHAAPPSCRHRLAFVLRSTAGQRSAGARLLHCLHATRRGALLCCCVRVVHAAALMLRRRLLTFGCPSASGLLVAYGTCLLLPTAGALLALPGPPGARLRGRPAPHQPSLLHERSGAGFPAAAGVSWSSLEGWPGGPRSALAQLT